MYFIACIRSSLSIIEKAIIIKNMLSLEYSTPKYDSR